MSFRTYLRNLERALEALTAKSEDIFGCPHCDEDLGFEVTIEEGIYKGARLLDRDAHIAPIAAPIIEVDEG